LKLVDSLVLETHTNEEGGLYVRQVGDLGLGQLDEVKLGNGWHKVHDEVEVN